LSRTVVCKKCYLHFTIEYVKKLVAVYVPLPGTSTGKAADRDRPLVEACKPRERSMNLVGRRIRVQVDLGRRSEGGLDVMRGHRNTMPFVLMAAILASPGAAWLE
jgi:hypothetical protein